MKRRFSGVTASIIAVMPALAKHYPVRVLGSGLPADVDTITWGQFVRHCWRGPWRVWHARRNTEMLAGLILRRVFRFRIILVFTSAAQRYHTRYTRMLYRRMEQLVATTDAAASYLDLPAIVVHHGVDTQLFHPPPDRAAAWRGVGGYGDFGIGIFGRVRPQKGTREFVDTLCATLPGQPRWGAALIGETTPNFREFHEQLEASTREAGIESRVKFVGKVEDFREIPDWYRAMTLVVIPPWVEGFGLTCLEAMASGCAVIASRTGAFPEIVEDGVTGWLVPCRDGEALSAKMEEILQDPERLHAVGQRARQRVERHFAIETEAEKLAAVYAGLFAKYE
jgi:mannosyltransferase